MNLTVNCLDTFCWAEIQDDLSLLAERYSPFHVEFGMGSECDFGDCIPHDDMPLCGTTDHGLSLLIITPTCAVIDDSVTTSSYEQICDSMFIMAQHNERLPRRQTPRSAEFSGPPKATGL
jgi:hypothetical protein